MPYIPEEHQRYPVLPYSREHGGEVFQYIDWPDKKFEELVGEHLIPYGYRSYEEYFSKVDSLLFLHADEPDAVRLLERCKQNIVIWNTKEEWSICKYVGEDMPLQLHHGGYYYWPSMKDDPRYNGIIDDEEFTAYLYPTDADLWEIVVDPTGMARRTIFGEKNGLTKDDYSFIMGQVEQMKPGDLTEVKTLGPVRQLNEMGK